MREGTGIASRKGEGRLGRGAVLSELPLVAALLIVAVLVALLAAGGPVLDLIRDVQSLRTS